MTPTNDASADCHNYQIWLRINGSGYRPGALVYLTTVKLARGRALLASLVSGLHGKAEGLAVSVSGRRRGAVLYRLTDRGWAPVDPPQQL
jgi:hypothetical protein